MRGKEGGASQTGAQDCSRTKIINECSFIEKGILIV